MEIVRQAANTLERLFRIAIELIEYLLRSPIRDLAGRSPESVDAQRHGGQPLAHVVVQIASDLGTRSFLRVDDSSQECGGCAWWRLPSAARIPSPG